MNKISEQIFSIKGLVALAFVVGMIACILIISFRTLTNTESALVGLFLTFLSLLASWILTDAYAQSQYKKALQEVKEEHRNNLRTYALKAAEKVNNLSNELHKLSLYLESELAYTDYRNSEEELLAKEERIESTVHLLKTLKSMNDTSLSDWEGVIGEELDQQREAQEEKEEELKNLIMRVESVLEDIKPQSQVFPQLDTSVRQEFDELKQTLRVAVSQLSGTPIPRKASNKEPKQDVSSFCPACNTEITYKQRGLARSIKQIPCKTCGAKLFSTYKENDGFNLKEKKIESVDIECPFCSHTATHYLSNIPGASLSTKCPKCITTMILIRKHDSTEVKLMPNLEVPKTNVLTDEFLDKVYELLPSQPWPTGVHRPIAEKLNVSATAVNRAINELTKRKRVLLQIDGVIYQPKANDSSS